MAEVVATSLLRFISDQLASKALSEFGLLTGLDKELNKLQSTLSTIRDVLEDAEARQVKERALRNWLRKLKDLAYEADDVLDDFAGKAAKLKPEMIDVKDKVRSFLSFPKMIGFRRKIAKRIKEINERLDEIAVERCSFVNESEVYGRHEDKEKIVEYLTKGSDDGDDIGVMAIVGLGGLGKTTLAQLVYNDKRVCEHFEMKMWVCVSEDFDIRRVIGSIIESATGKEFGVMNMDALQMALRKELREKRFLLVLDDVWNESHEKWDRLRSLLALGAKGSKVIVTTRSDRVASIMGTVGRHPLLGLSMYDCWLLFESRAFGSAEGAKNPNLIEIGKEIVKKCGGIPLAAKALGSLLRFKRTESEWLAIKDSELWKLSDDENYEVLPALKLSYDHLTPTLKQCFAYCSIFPKDHMIKTDILVQLWSAEGFLQPSEVGISSEEIGFRYVDELLARSLFQKGEDSIGGVEREVKMHDLVHDLAQSVTGNECSIPDSFKKLKHLRYLDLSNTPLESLPPCINTLHNLQTLNLSNSNIKSVPNFIGDLHNLSTLDLSHCVFLPSLPDSIGRLKELRKLDLSFCQIASLPESISALSNLQTLGLASCYFIHELPENTSNMRSLVKLDISRCYQLTCMPKGIGKLSHLRHLPMFIPGGKTKCSLAELGSLKLEGRLQIIDLQEVMKVDEAKDVHLKDKHRIRSLDLSWNTKQALKDDNEDYSAQDLVRIQAAENMLQSLEPSNSLRTLEIKGYAGRAFPPWMIDLRLSNLVNLTLSSCFRCEKLPALGQLPQLEVLNLRALPQIKHLDSDFYGGNNAFLSLKELELNCLEGLEEWFSGRDGVFLPCLTKLRLFDCPNLITLPSDFPTVTHLNMNADDKLLSSLIQNGAFPNLKHMHVENWDDDNPEPEVFAHRVESLTSWSLGTKPKPKDEDSTVMSSFGFGMAHLVGGQGTIEFPIG
ncbi:Putative disease resistance protein RGA3 [Apostasia shenzhenica]|uniref:Disease resistance protein RGA3 n=1 Tax=Apostasia shenzhenica TaxID=1088818 RepID=A0A2I0BGN0_9ASPA|nr:Putative disease resistance protein RGA3 [Apostasia shenzhenica]